RVDGRRPPAADRLARRRGGPAMTTYADIVAAATVGLAQRPLAVTGLAGPAGAHADVLPDEPATAVLAAAALFDAAQRAGGLRADVWETGFPAERVAWLRDRRAADPAAGRDVLAGAWTREHGDDRAGLLAALDVGLGSADEEFLEQALDDRRADVREEAR